MLLNDVLMCAWPMAMFLRTRRRVRPRAACRRGGAISGHLRCSRRARCLVKARVARTQGAFSRRLGDATEDAARRRIAAPQRVRRMPEGAVIKSWSLPSRGRRSSWGPCGFWRSSSCAGRSPEASACWKPAAPISDSRLIDCWRSRRRSPSTWRFPSMYSRSFVISGSVRSRTFRRARAPSPSRSERRRAPDPEDVGQADLESPRGKADACDSCHLALPLLVSRVRADDHGVTVPLDHAAALTHRLDGRADFHLIYA